MKYLVSVLALSSLYGQTKNLGNLSNVVSPPVSSANGGTGVDTSASTGIPKIAAGIWSVATPTGTGAPVLAVSPALTGTPTAPTAAANDNSTKLATTAYVDGSGTTSARKNTPWIGQPVGFTGNNYDVSTHLTLIDGTVISNSVPSQGQVLLLFTDITNSGNFTIKTDGATNVPVITQAGAPVTANFIPDGNALGDSPFPTIFAFDATDVVWVLQGAQPLGAGAGITVGTVPGQQSIAVTNPVRTGTTAAIGGGLLAAGACTAETTVTVSGATTAMVATASPTATDSSLANASWPARVSAANTVAVKVCLGILGTPAAETYNVRVQ